MEQPGKLSDLLGDVPSYTDDPALDWEQAGPKIEAALAERSAHIRWRLLYRLVGGTGLVAMLLLIIGSLADQDPAQPLTIIESSDQSSTVPQDVNSIVPSSPTLEAAPRRAPLVTEGVATPLFTTPSAQSSRAVTNPPRTALAPSRRTLQMQFEELSASANSAFIAAGSVEPLQLVASEISLAASPLRSDELTASSGSESSSETRQGATQPLVAWSSPVQVVSLVDPPDTLLPILDRRMSNTQAARTSFFVWAGSSLPQLEGQYAYAEGRLGLSTEVGLRYRWHRNFYGTVGIAYSKDRVQTAFTRRTPVRLYRPGTVDTIYRYSTGQEEVITTDSVPGLEIQTFRHTSSFQQLSFPVQLGYAQSWKRLAIQAEIGLLPVLWQAARGVVTNADYELRDLPGADGVELRLHYRFALGFEVPLGAGYMGVRYTYGYRPVTTRAALPLAVRQRQSLQLGYRYEW